ncbi:hypothetical protein M404DRAFT_999731 [Pisolithus tinctorius Marx 270]|uniref:Uncharacterized protein n=1 Tax=Pisolithus tinctorius Marx 270 TaxID=870435 RepID=A0A0C3K7L1_PISTI|nr:hypothetical protein M404DRAFT_999731 [Pisolithus tinctorius Marx 270]
MSQAPEHGLRASAMESPPYIGQKGEHRTFLCKAGDSYETLATIVAGVTACVPSTLGSIVPDSPSISSNRSVAKSMESAERCRIYP